MIAQPLPGGAGGAAGDDVDAAASLSRIARAKIAASTRAGAPAMMRHGTDEACVPGHRAMDGHVIERVAGARPGRMLA
jgi:hypothetical protein